MPLPSRSAHAIESFASGWGVRRSLVLVTGTDSGTLVSECTSPSTQPFGEHDAVSSISSTELGVSIAGQISTSG